MYKVEVETVAQHNYLTDSVEKQTSHLSTKETNAENLKVIMKTFRPSNVFGRPFSAQFWYEK